MCDGRTWREGVLSLKHRRCNETNQYHPTQQSPHENDRLPGNENVHGRTSRDESGLRLPPLYCEKTQIFMNILAQFLAQELLAPEGQQRQEGRESPPIFPARRYGDALVRLKPYLHVTDSHAAVRPIIEHV